MSYHQVELDVLPSDGVGRLTIRWAGRLTIKWTPYHQVDALPSGGRLTIRWTPYHQVDALPSGGRLTIRCPPYHQVGALPSSGRLTIKWTPYHQYNETVDPEAIGLSQRNLIHKTLLFEGSCKPKLTSSLHCRHASFCAVDIINSTLGKALGGAAGMFVHFTGLV